MKPILFISSMFRSGTTFVARMLNIHPHIACASDPMRPLVNSFRYDLADDSYRSVHSRYDPLDDYFIHNTDLLNRVLHGDMNLPLGCNAKDLLSAVQRRAEPFSGIYSESINLNENVRTYRETVAYLLNIVQQSYANTRDVHLLAFKEVWSNELYPALRRSFPGAKCLMIIRDPRSIVASKIATGEPYPLSFMGRQWRKLACLTAFLKHSFPDDVLILRYEDLVSSPDKYIREICKLCGLNFDSNMLDVSLYKDGRQKEWKQNTSFSDVVPKSINTKTVEKWKTILTSEETATLELYTYDWMKTFGYPPAHNLDNLLAIGMKDYKAYKNHQLAEWIRSFSFDEDSIAVEREIAIEKLRLANLDMAPNSLRQSLHLAWWQS